MESDYHPSGEHKGKVINSRLIAGFHLTETAYEAGVRLPRHEHRYGCFCTVLKGSYSERYGKTSIECNADKVIFRPPEEAHADLIDNAPAVCFIVEFSPEWLSTLDEYRVRTTEPAQFQKRSFGWLMTRIRYESAQVDKYTSLTIEGLMLELAGEFARFSNRISESRPPAWLKQAKEILHASFAARSSLASIANTVGVHPVYLATAFRRHFHCSVGEYVRGLRIEFACQQLSRSQNSIVDIAYAAGFTHQSHFSRTFKRLTGMTPAQYRHTAQRP